MHKITFECETITPMFLSGADGSTPELRPPSIKGMLRFWARALALEWSSNNGKEDLKRLLKNDELLFGGTTKERPKSKVTITCFESTTKKDWVRANSEEVIPRRRQGIEYLFYTFKYLQKDRDGFRKGVNFKVQFSCKEEDQASLRKFIAAFWALTFLGGVGSRARRGAGAFTVSSIQDPKGVLNDIQLSFIPESSSSNLRDFLRTNLLCAKQILSGQPLSEKTDFTPKLYSTIAVDKIWVANNGKDWIGALDEIGNELFAWRDKKPNTNEQYELSDLGKKAAFGLPVAVRITKDKCGKTLFGGGKLTNSTDRRASPIIISVIRVGKDDCHWILSQLNGNPFEQGEKLKFDFKRVIDERKDSLQAKVEQIRYDASLMDSFMTEKVKKLATQL